MIVSDKVTEEMDDIDNMYICICKNRCLFNLNWIQTHTRITMQLVRELFSSKVLVATHSAVDLQKLTSYSTTATVLFGMDVSQKKKQKKNIILYVFLYQSSSINLQLNRNRDSLFSYTVSLCLPWLSESLFLKYNKLKFYLNKFRRN